MHFFLLHAFCIWAGSPNCSTIGPLTYHHRADILNYTAMGSSTHHRADIPNYSVIGPSTDHLAHINHLACISIILHISVIMHFSSSTYTYHFLHPTKKQKHQKINKIKKQQKYFLHLAAGFPFLSFLKHKKP